MKLKGLFKYLGKKIFTPHFVKIVNNSTQIFVVMQNDDIKLILRYKVGNEEEKFWLAICSDGTRENFSESDGILKLITFYKTREKKAEAEKANVKHWLSLKSSDIFSGEEIGEQEGTFIQFDTDTIESRNHILLKMFRALMPSKTDSELKEFMSDAISSQKSSGRKKSIYPSNTPDPLRQKEIDTSIIDKSNQNQKKPANVSTSLNNDESGDNTFPEKKMPCCGKNNSLQPNNGKKNSELEEAINKLTKTSSCSMLNSLSRKSSMLSLNSQPVTISRNSSQLSLNSIDSDAKKGRSRRGRNRKKIPAVEEDPEDKRFNEILKKYNVKTEGVLRNNKKLC